MESDNLKSQFLTFMKHFPESSRGVVTSRIVRCVHELKAETFDDGFMEFCEAILVFDGGLNMLVLIDRHPHLAEQAIQYVWECERGSTPENK